jgi:aconitate hydratase
MLPAREDGSITEGGFTLLEGQQTTVYQAAMTYLERNTPTVVFAGEEYGTGSSRDWAAKGTRLLGVRAVIARSFERIHRNNLVGMGVLPLQFKDGTGWRQLGLKGDELFDILDIDAGIKPQQDVRLVVTRPDGERTEISVRLRIDTPIEVEYYVQGGILPYVLREILKAS